MNTTVARKVLITGASKGLGILLSKELMNNNYEVIASDIYNEDELSKEAKEYFSSYYPFDLSNSLNVRQFVKQIFTDHPEIEIIINNAGILNFRFLDEYTDEDVLKTISVNLASAVLIIKNSIPFLKENRKGRIINVSSSSSFRGFETGCAYTPTKAGLNLFTESFRKELAILKKKTGIDITINNVCPGRIATKEFLEENPKVKPKSLVSHVAVFNKIISLINSNKNGEIIPLFPGKLKREILKKEIKRFLI